MSKSSEIGWWRIVSTLSASKNSQLQAFLVGNTRDTQASGEIAPAADLGSSDSNIWRPFGF